MKIPRFEMPGPINGTKFIDEELIDIKKYFGNTIITESDSDSYLIRKTVIEKLEIAMHLLPENITLKIYNAWQPLETQDALYDKSNDIEYLTMLYDDIVIPASHNSGGAIDLTLFDKTTCAELNMGTKLGNITEKTVTDYYETTGADDVRVNRRLLYVTMINAGFTNLPSKWWHYDYGNAFWSYYTGKPMIYRGMPDSELPVIFR